MGPRNVLTTKDVAMIKWTLDNARMWTVHKPTTTEDEGCRTNTNKGYTIPK